jgi:hypothetical protein
MQTRKFGLRALALAFVSVMTLGVAACDDTEVVPAPTQTTIDISPSGTIDIFVGDRVQVVANAQNAPQGATTTFASSNTAVATVDANGVVTGVAPGIATITATSNANQGGTVRAAMTVRVSARTPTTPPPGTGTASVIITGIETAQGDAVTTNNVSGTVVVRMEVTPGPADSLVVSLGNRRACAISFSAATSLVTADGQQVEGAQVPLSCTINTATIGVVNGATTVSARLFDNNAVIASNQQSLTLNNPATATATAVGSRQAINPQTGLQWNGGDITVTVTPATFGGASVGRVFVTMLDAAGNPLGGTGSDTSATNGAFQVVFEEDDLEGIVSENLQFRISATTTTGQQFTFPGGGTTQNTTGIRYDNAVPTVDDDVLSEEAREFLGDVSLNDMVSDIAEETLGVDGVRVTFFTSEDDTLDPDEIIEEGDTLTDIGDLEEGEEFTLAALVCDALNNCVELEGFTFTVDVTVPTVEAIAVEDSAVFNAGDPTTGTLTVDVADELSGFDGTGLVVSATRTYLSGTTTTTVCVIGDEATEATTDAAFGDVNGAAFRGDGEVGTADTTCEPVEITEEIPVPDAAGYYTFNIQAVDVAGNISAAERITILVDPTAPTVTNVDFSASLDGGDEETVEARIDDNLDLEAYQVGVDFTGGFGSLPLTSRQIVDTSFGTPLTRRRDINQAVFFVQSLREDQDAGDAFDPGADFLADDIAIFAEDQAGNRTVSQTNITQTFTSSGFPTVTAFNVESTTSGASDELCLEDDCEDGAESLPLRVTLETATAADAPVERVQFYALIDGQYYLIATDESATTTVTTTRRRYVFNASITTAFIQGLTTAAPTGRPLPEILRALGFEQP